MDKWSPFREAEQNLKKYLYFFNRDSISDAFGDHPQLLEDWLHERCPNNYCYVWLWSNSFNFSKPSSIVDYLIGVPEEIAMPLKLMTGLNPTIIDNYRVHFDGKKYQLETSCQD